MGACMDVNEKTSPAVHACRRLCDPDGNFDVGLYTAQLNAGLSPKRARRRGAAPRCRHLAARRGLYSPTAYIYPASYIGAGPQCLAL